MTQNNGSFQAANIGARFRAACIKLDNLVVQGDTPELTEVRKKLHEGLKNYRQQGVLSAAFVGQYSAGKSTIISALTGRRDIKIDADIATDKSTRYGWNEIQIIDTPGLFTERKDHDKTTYDAIEKADLLIFCLTYMLFDSLTVENFKKLAFEKGYRWKIMLVINKMSDEAGEEQQKIANYCKSLADALKPYSLDEFPVCFIDAKDYCEGIDEQEEFLLKASRFQTFTHELNQFVQRRATLARLDTPIRIALGSVDDAQVNFTRNSNQDSSYLEVLARLSRTVQKERDRLKTKTQTTILKMSSAIAKEGTVLAAAVGGEENFEILNKQSEINVRRHCEQAGEEMQSAIDKAGESIQTEIEKVLQSELIQAFVARLEFDQNISAQNSRSGINLGGLRSQVGQLQDIGQGIGVRLTKAATRDLVSTASSGFLRSMDVAGSSLHTGVLSAGKFVGFKFKPWQAVGVAKNIGNAALFLGPVLALVSLGMDAHAMYQEHERERKMAEARQDITSEFQSIAKDLETQIELQLMEWETQCYGDIEGKIVEARRQEEGAIANSNQWVKQLLEIRQEFEALLYDISPSRILADSPTKV